MHRLLIDQNVRIEVADSLRADGREVLRAFLMAYASADLRNALVILTESKVRIRRW
jgi:hypothetical protein